LNWSKCTFLKNTLNSSRMSMILAKLALIVDSRIGTTVLGILATQKFIVFEKEQRQLFIDKQYSGRESQAKNARGEQVHHH
jgi:hypothetical protein